MCLLEMILNKLIMILKIVLVDQTLFMLLISIVIVCIVLEN